MSPFELIITFMLVPWGGKTVFTVLVAAFAGWKFRLFGEGWQKITAFTIISMVCAVFLWQFLLAPIGASVFETQILRTKVSQWVRKIDSESTVRMQPQSGEKFNFNFNSLGLNQTVRLLDNGYLIISQSGISTAWTNWALTLPHEERLEKFRELSYSLYRQDEIEFQLALAHNGQPLDIQTFYRLPSAEVSEGSFLLAVRGLHNAGVLLEKAMNQQIERERE